MCLVSRDFGGMNVLCEYPFRFSFWIYVRKKKSTEANDLRVYSITKSKKGEKM